MLLDDATLQSINVEWAQWHLEAARRLTHPTFHEVEFRRAVVKAWIALDELIDSWTDGEPDD